MPSQQEIVDLLRADYPFLAAEYGVKRLGVFGSFARGRPGPASDVDLLVEFEKPIGLKFMELAEHLESLLGRRVDLLTPDGLQGIRVRRVAVEIADSIVYV